MGNSDNEEMADIDRIINERKKRTMNCTTERQPNKRRNKNGPTCKEYLCTWMDGAAPQWIDGKHLLGTIALEEWIDAEEEIPEQYDASEVVMEKCLRLIELMKNSKRISFLVGAGVSASVLPTFRGKGGLWTRKADSSIIAQQKPAPTLTHRVLMALEKRDMVHWVASQNYDDLFNDVSFPTSKLSELHGNIYMESCSKCGTNYHRDFEVELSTAKCHETGRYCDNDLCNGILKDNIVHFGEDLPYKALLNARTKLKHSELRIVLGSSLKVEPAESLPFIGKGKTVIINLQPTPYDDDADLIIHAKCEDVMNIIAKNILGNDWDNN